MKQKPGVFVVLISKLILISKHNYLALLFGILPIGVLWSLELDAISSWHERILSNEHSRRLFQLLLLVRLPLPVFFL